MRPPLLAARSLIALCLVGGLASAARPPEETSVDLSGLDAWRAPVEGWAEAGSVTLDPKDVRKLASVPGSGLIHNGPEGKARNLVSKAEFGDVSLHVEFFLPKGSNSGVKFQSIYEIQIYDSYGSTRKLTGRESGGVYPRSEQEPFYHQIDDGIAPLVNAAKPPGEWQVLDATFRAPKFDASGKKTASARITAVLNGRTVQDDREVPTPTGSAWHDPEKPAGPILIQADHGPVAYRNLRAHRLDAKP